MATALELGRDGWRPYVDAARRRSRGGEPGAQPDPEKEQLLARIREAAGQLKKRFGVKRVFLFGSLAHGGWYRPTSDVDLAVEGVSGSNYWKAWRLVEEILGDRNVDFIDLEMAGDSLKRAVARHGIEL